jgi:hypothetical protein
MYFILFQLYQKSTSTPGVTGEERRKELKRRLMVAICGEGKDTNEVDGYPRKSREGGEVNNHTIIKFILQPFNIEPDSPLRLSNRRQLS